MDNSDDDIFNDYGSFLNGVIFKSSRGKYSEFCKFIGSKETLHRYDPDEDIENILECLDVYDHSLGVLDVLFYKYNLGILEIEWPRVFKITKNFFLECCYTQTRYCPGAFCDLLHLFSSFCLRYNSALAGIAPMTHAMDMMARNTRRLTIIHTDLLLLCLRAQCVKPALKYLNREIDYITVNCTENGAESVLLYYYYGAIIYIIVENYKRACYFLEIVVSTHASIGSQIVLQAYNKYRLVSMLHYGCYVTLPSDSSNLGKCYAGLSEPYLELSTHFDNNDILGFASCMEKYRESLSVDHNYTLVEQVRQVLRFKRIKKIRNVFANVSLAEITMHLKESDQVTIEKMLIEMVGKSEIHVSIDCRTEIVKFPHHVKQMDGIILSKEIEKKIEHFLNSRVEYEKMTNNLMLSYKHYKNSIEKDKENHKI